MTAVSKSMNIAAPADKIRGVILDVGQYPVWQKEITKVDVRETDAEGRPDVAEISVSAMGQEASYVVKYDYSDDTKISYHLIEGDMMTKQDATFTLVPGDGDTTDVTVELEVAVKWALPEFMINQLSLKGVKDLLKGLKTKSEQ